MSAATASDPLALLLSALAPLVRIANAYDANELDDEARKSWGLNGEHTNQRLPDEIQLYTGRGGTELLTLADCFAARGAAKLAAMPAAAPVAPELSCAETLKEAERLAGQIGYTVVPDPVHADGEVHEPELVKQMAPSLHALGFKVVPIVDIRVPAHAATVDRTAAMAVRPERSETFHLQAAGYAAGWSAAIAAYRRGIYVLPSAPNSVPARPAGFDALIEAAREFCRRVEAGEVRSKRSYAAFKGALAGLPAKEAPVHD